LAIAALVLGILGMLTSWFMLGLIFAVLGLVFGALALSKKQSKGMAIAGIVMSVLGILSAIAVLALVKEVAEEIEGIDTEQIENYLDSIPVDTISVED
jgi:ABC-type transport system involved in multi-copper enzyme maturation permease subunit